jgi:hypothetical protein
LEIRKHGNFQILFYYEYNYLKLLSIRFYKYIFDTSDINSDDRPLRRKPTAKYIVEFLLEEATSFEVTGH